MRQHVVLAALVLAHIVLASWYASITPYRTGGIILGQMRSPAKDIGAPDERQHANYVQRLLDGRGFPVLGAAGEDSYENYQAHQPPVYYLIEAGWSKLVGVADVSNQSTGFRLRFMNCLIGAGTVCGVYFLGLWGFRRRDVAVCGAVFAALLPMNLVLSGAISNDPLLFLLCTWTLAVCAKGVRDGWTLRLGLWVGVLLGLAFLTKTTSVALVPAVLAAIAGKQAARPAAKVVGLSALLALVIAAPWWARNQKLYGDPFALSAFQHAFTGNPSPATFIEPAVAEGKSRGQATFEYWTDWVGWWTARSFVGAFGYMDIFLNERGTPYTGPASPNGAPAAPNTLYRISLGFLALLALGWALSLRDEGFKEAAAVQVVNGVFLAVVVLLFVQFNNHYFQGQARYLLPAIGPLSVGFGIGALHWGKGRLPLAAGALAVLLLAINVYALKRLPTEFAARIAPQFGTPP